MNSSNSINPTNPINKKLTDSLYVTTDVDPATWDYDVVKLNGCCFHSYGWSLYSSENNNARPLYFHLYNRSLALRSLAFGRLTSQNLAGIPVYKTLSFGCLPASEDKSALQSMINKIISYSRKNHIVSLAIHSSGTPFGSEGLQQLGFSVEKRWEFLLNVNGSEQALWKKIHSKKRNLIRKGQKSKLRIEQGSQIEHVMQFRILALKTQQRKKQQGISFPVVGSEHSYRLLKSKLIDTGLGKLYLAYDGDQAVAGAFLVGFNNKAYYMLSSANEIGLKKAAPDLILWNCMTDYQKEGYKVFNLGGVSESELNGKPIEKSGLYHFKKRFSADVYFCYKGRIILRPNIYNIHQLLAKLKLRLFQCG